jgi:hypothetical protein
VRIPTRSEQEAFRLTLGAASVIAVAVLVGSLTDPWIGVAAFALALGAAAIAYLRAENPDRHTPLGDAARQQHRHGPRPGVHHVLVVANEVLDGAELRERIVAGGDGDVELDILAPVLLSRVHLGVSDIDRELEQARARLDRSLSWAREQGVAACGRVGDPSSTIAIADELRDFGADEVIVVTHARDRATWQERDDLARLQRELDLPVHHVTVGEAGARPGAG